MIRLVIGDLRRRWLEYLMGASAISVVIAALVVQRAMSVSAEESIHELAHKLGKNMLVVPAATDLGEFYRQRYDRSALPSDAVDRIRGAEMGAHIRTAESRLYGNATVNREAVIVVGRDGRWPLPSGNDGAPALAGAEAARRLGVGVGATVTIGGVPLRIIDVIDSAPEGLDNAVFVPLATAQQALGRPGEVNALQLGGCWCRVDVPTLAANVEKLLPGSRALTVAGMAKAQKGSVATMARYSSMLHVAGGSLVAAVVAALVSSQARRRVREVGLLIAIGLPPVRVVSTMVLQSGVVGLLGALGGWLLAVPATRHLATRLLGVPVVPSAELLIPVLAATVLLSVLVALAPAWRASTLDPTVVLRES